MPVTLGAIAAWRVVAGLRPLHPQWPRLASKASYRLSGSFSGKRPQGGGSGGGGGGSRQLPLFAVPSYRLARKSEEDLAAEAAQGGDVGGEDGSRSGGRFPFKVRGLGNAICPHTRACRLPTHTVALQSRPTLHRAPTSAHADVPAAGRV